jgi:hypothetical protein
MLPLSAGRTVFRSATPPHSLAAVTVPEYVLNPMRRDSLPYR